MRAKIEAEKQDRTVRDGEIVTACQQACPSEAIVFGNINDPNSRVSKLKAQDAELQLAGGIEHAPAHDVSGASCGTPIRKCQENACLRATGEPDSEMSDHG